MDFKKCSEVYGYKSIAEVEEEEIEAKLSVHDEKIAKGFLREGVFAEELKDLLLSIGQSYLGLERS